MGDQQEFCLRWNDFHSNFHLSLEALRGDESFTDVTLSCSGRLMRAHRVILSACSVHFKEILRGIPPQQHPVIVLPTVDYEVMQAILEFIYQGQVNVKQSQLGAFLQVAETFSIQGLADDDTKKNANKASSRPRPPDAEPPPAKRRRPEPSLPRPGSPPAAAATSAAPAAPAAGHSAEPAGQEASAEAGKTVNISVSIKAEGMADTMVGELLEHSQPGQMLDPDMEAASSDVVAQAMATMGHESGDASATILSVATPPRPPQTQPQPQPQPSSSSRPAQQQSHTSAGGSSKRSVVWEYFTMEDDTMICKVCGKQLRGNDGLVPFNSSNFWKHLRRMHDIV